MDIGKTSYYDQAVILDATLKKAGDLQDAPNKLRNFLGGQIERRGLDSILQRSKKNVIGLNYNKLHDIITKKEGFSNGLYNEYAVREQQLHNFNAIENNRDIGLKIDDGNRYLLSTDDIADAFQLQFCDIKDYVTLSNFKDKQLIGICSNHESDRFSEENAKADQNRIKYSITRASKIPLTYIHELGMDQNYASTSEWLNTVEKSDTHILMNIVDSLKEKYYKKIEVPVSTDRRPLSEIGVAYPGFN